MRTLLIRSILGISQMNLKGMHINSLILSFGLQALIHCMLEPVMLEIRTLNSLRVEKSQSQKVCVCTNMWCELIYAEELKQWVLSLNCSYSVYISEEQMNTGSSIESELRKYSEEKISQMRETIILMIPRLLYGRQSESLGFERVEGDAFDTTIQGELEKVAKYKASLQSL